MDSKIQVALAYLETTYAIGKIVLDGAQKILVLINKIR